MKKLVLVLIFLMSISFVSALCEEEQININDASKERLDELYGIGPVKAEAIIHSRPFESVEELIRVLGIGDVTLEKILAQGLACVEEKENVNDVEEVEKEEPEKIIEGVIEDENIKKEEEEEKVIITLTATTIKSPDNKKNKSNYAVYGFVAFCVLLGILFTIKKKKYKNEFR